MEQKEKKTIQDALILGGKEFASRFILGSGKYSMELIKAAAICKLERDWDV